MPAPTPSGPGDLSLATFGGGCFWCIEAVFDDLEGVIDVAPGYSGGSKVRPTYEQVCRGDTGHAEVIQLKFDPRTISYEDILRIFFTVHDPTTPNRQGHDVGTQYRSVIFAHDAAQLEAAKRVKQEIESAHLWPSSIVTEITPFQAFYPAEEYHRDYYRRNPSQGYCQMVIAPKVVKFRKQYANRLKRA